MFIDWFRQTQMLNWKLNTEIWQLNQGILLVIAKVTVFFPIVLDDANNMQILRWKNNDIFREKTYTRQLR